MTKSITRADCVEAYNYLSSIVGDNYIEKVVARDNACQVAIANKNWPALEDALAELIYQAEEELDYEPCTDHPMC